MSKVYSPGIIQRGRQLKSSATFGAYDVLQIAAIHPYSPLMAPGNSPKRVICLLTCPVFPSIMPNLFAHYVQTWDNCIRNKFIIGRRSIVHVHKCLPMNK